MVINQKLDGEKALGIRLALHCRLKQLLMNKEHLLSSKQTFPCANMDYYYT